MEEEEKIRGRNRVWRAREDQDVVLVGWIVEREEEMKTVEKAQTGREESGRTGRGKRTKRK